MRSWTPWIIGFVIYIALAGAFMWFVWFKHGQDVDPANPKDTKTIYADWRRAMLPYWLGAVGAYYAVYVIALLTSGPGADRARELQLHLAIWTLVPPLWFAFEWFVWFDHSSKDASAALKSAQDIASKFWAAVLALLVSYRLGDVIKEALKAKS